ncbi:MAG: UDP-2,3-diacylglucosamine diphosphatase LpxI [Mariniblastus sp.]|nr:UDP-2,3-diacylglucosamine diphosphatase LpxI [Mariniblastus sp.]
MTNSTTSHKSEKRIGLVAGWGRFPIQVAIALKTAGYQVYCCGIYGHADPELENICDEFEWFGMARMGSQVRFLKRCGVHSATMAGKIFKTLLFQKFHLIKHLPDWECMKYFYPVYFTKKKDRRDDTLLTIVTELYASNGIQFSPATDFAPELLVKRGTLTRKSPSQAQLLDIKFAWEMAKEMGRLDIGQSIAVKGRAVLAVEAVEGTDECIRRAGQLCSAGGFTVVKVAKPQQDMRFDVPTVGVGTIQTMKDAGASVLAVEASKTIVLDQSELVAYANQVGISVVALESDCAEKLDQAA